MAGNVQTLSVFPCLKAINNMILLQDLFKLIFIRRMNNALVFFVQFVHNVLIFGSGQKIVQAFRA